MRCPECEQDREDTNKAVGCLLIGILILLAYAFTVTGWILAKEIL